MSDTLYILLPVHNRCSTTAGFIDCLERQIFTEYHLVLIDDGSDDGTSDMVHNRVKQLTVLEGDGSLWWAGALQKGYEWLKAHPETHGEMVLIMNDDTSFQPDFLARGTELLRSRPDTLLLAHCFSQQTGVLLDSGTHVDWMRLIFENAEAPERINCLSTRGLFLRVSDFIRIGGFYPRLLPHYGSDYEFTIRARRKGFALTVEPTLKLWVDTATTGYHETGAGTFVSSVQQLFSNRTLANPVRWAWFILLACPLPWKLLCLLRVGWGTLLHFLAFARRAAPNESKGVVR